MGSKYANLEKILELSKVSPSRFITTSLPAAPVGARGTFGGTLVAQALLASLYTVPNKFVPTSLHCYFVSGGDPSHMITYDVQDLRHGRNFIHKHVKAYQKDRLIFTSTILFSMEKHNHDSLHFLKTIPPGDVPKLEAFEDSASLFRSQVIDNGNLERYAHLSPTFKDPKNMEKYEDSFRYGAIEYKFPHDMFYSQRRTDMLEEFVRIRQPVTTTERNQSGIPSKITPKNDLRYNYVAFAYLSDSYFLLTVPYFHKLPMYSHRFSVSLDHCIHFHQVPDVNDWVYIQIGNPRSHWDKHLVQGEYYNATSGEIVASVSQEGLVVYDSEREIRAKF